MLNTLYFMMRQIFVEKIVDTAKIRFGYSLTNKKVFQVLQEIYNGKELDELLLSAMEKDTSSGLHLIERFHQFVLVVHIVFGNECHGRFT